MAEVLVLFSSIIIRAIEATGYIGIAGLMALESANIPIPSEIIMPFSGYLASRGQFSFFAIVIAGAIGNLVGSIASYYLGSWGGRRFLSKYGKFLFMHKKDLDSADQWFNKYGDAAIFFSRILPIVRTFISLPAGIAKMNIWKFSAYTFVGSLLWSWFLAYVGFAAGENWAFLEPYFRKFDWAIAAFLILAAVWWVRRYFKVRDSNSPSLNKARKEKSQNKK